MEAKNKIHLGQFSLCINVKDIKTSLAFYQKLDFKEKGGDINDGWVILHHGNLELGLFQGHFKEPYLLNFRKDDAYKIDAALKNRGMIMKSDAEKESDGSVGATLEDPDGNLIYFNTHPDEII